MAGNKMTDWTLMCVLSALYVTGQRVPLFRTWRGGGKKKGRKQRIGDFQHRLNASPQTAGVVYLIEGVIHSGPEHV